MPEKVWVLGTRTPACRGKVRLAIFRGRKHIPLKQEALNDLESSSPLFIPEHPYDDCFDCRRRPDKFSRFCQNFDQTRWSRG
ncbi:MAG: hypothetical protein EWV75_18565 [Microcystis wesenbergii Mw_QC_S_20081001_S30D]|uniref:Uncharacterized protein n=2 Tax=Microcystis wesenbergii TaxID=44823 RepID=A0A552LQ34_9CHRO|nr:MAG: hypothetical protein EWV75_18565 [Microcystis wesenbergii Mw_QC_S_20081001_S30D]TRV02369.1 MAG: hypothetical protein EWV73_07080 [Microcystis wesenbergii Mw_QC_B_20070930_S4D]TRV11168.1 MAG: hypothetical protein EWV41_05920 [Microcystis wesenbergii Mw_MB_S_20031200_S109]TRV14695.1 MAG: hypothetical protein EWV89_09055 [Microcystis wesenbergii Mw_QC_B_20070930_S4]TRV22343.1 MAG: hypothetical protein EWV88_13690 [Microcystis wesenbergii Mw_MB_S_20031200_S109D]